VLEPVADIDDERQQKHEHWQPKDDHEKHATVLRVGVTGSPHEQPAE
jgi:hypothetical protein